MAILTEDIDIKIGGNSWENIKNNYIFSDVHLVQEIQKPSELRFKIRKNTLNEDKDDLRLKTFSCLLGQKVELTLTTLRLDAESNKNEEALSFEGIIIDVNATRQTMAAGMVLDVLAYSPDYVLNGCPNCHSYENRTLEEIVKDKLTNIENIKAEVEPMMTESIPYVVQYNETNLQFISRLAQRYGEWFYYDGKKLIFGKMKQQKSEELVPDFDIRSYCYHSNLKNIQFSHLMHTYNPYENHISQEQDFKPGESKHKLADMCYKESEKISGNPNYQVLHSATPEESSLEQTEHSIKILASEKKSQMLVCTGKTNRVDLKLGSVIAIKEIFDDGKDFHTHDEMVICKIIHSAELAEKYENEFYAVPADSPHPPYSFNDVYPQCETQRAVVMDNKDPDKLGRIRVQFLWQKEQNDNDMITPWIRIAQPHGGDQKGFYFIPEIGEEVMVGFENGNAERPYVIGTLYHGNQKPKDGWYTDENERKGIRTRNGHRIVFIDEGDKGGIVITDGNDENDFTYQIFLSTDNKLIRLESKGNIELYAEEDITLRAKHDISMRADNDVAIVAHNNIYREADNNINDLAHNDFSLTTENDMTVYVENNRNTNVEKNDSLKVGENQVIAVEGDKGETISGGYQLSADSMRLEASSDMKIYSSNHEQKADSEMKLDGGSGLDLYASTIKIN